MKYVPLYDNLLLKIVEPKKEDTIISVTDTDIKTAIVVSHGWDSGMDDGDTVLFFLRDARKLMLEEGTYYLIPSKDILLFVDHV